MSLLIADVVGVIAEFLPQTDETQRNLMLVSSEWRKGVIFQNGCRPLPEVEWDVEALEQRLPKKLVLRSTATKLVLDEEAERNDLVKACAQLPAIGKELTDLHLSPQFRYITDACLVHVAGLKSLTVLNLHGCRGVTDEGIRKGLQQLSDVTDLDVSFTPITGDGLAVIAECMKKMQNLNVAGCLGIDNAALGCLKQLPELTTLNMNFTILDETGVTHLLELPSLTALTIGTVAPELAIGGALLASSPIALSAARFKLDDNLFTNPPCDPFAFDASTPPHGVPLRMLPRFVQMLFAEDAEPKQQAALMIRKLLSVDSYAPIDSVVKFGCTERLTEIMQSETENHPLQFECSWSLSNIASGSQEQTYYAINTPNLISATIELLSSPSKDCREQGVWTLGNLAGEGAACRDTLLDVGVLEPLLSVIASPVENPSTLKNAVWALSNLCRGEPVVNFDKIRSAFPVIKALPGNPENDDDVEVSIKWAICYLTQNASEDSIQQLLDADLIGAIFSPCHASAALTPQVRALANIATGGSLEHLWLILQHPQFAEQMGIWMASKKKSVSNAALQLFKTVCMRCGEKGVEKLIEAKVVQNVCTKQSLEPCVFHNELDQFQLKAEAFLAFLQNASLDQQKNCVSMSDFSLFPFRNVLTKVGSTNAAPMLPIVLEVIETVLSVSKDALVRQEGMGEPTNEKLDEKIEDLECELFIMENSFDFRAMVLKHFGEIAEVKSRYPKSSEALSL